jgi:uncharacterized protein DUF4259
MMGAWGYGPFENDDALDFVADLETTTGTGHLSTVLSAIADDRSEYVEAPESSAAIAAAEVVAALLGYPHPELPEEVTLWVAQQAGSHADLAREALRAVGRIAESSELREMAEEDDDFPSWQESIADLIGRLRAGPVA